MSSGDVESTNSVKSCGRERSRLVGDLPADPGWIRGERDRRDRRDQRENGERREQGREQAADDDAPGGEPPGAEVAGERARPIRRGRAMVHRDELPPGCRAIGPQVYGPRP
jgi:hypothetical protein